MNLESKEIKISRILNLPIEGEQSVDISVSFQFDSSKGGQRIFDDALNNIDMFQNLVQRKELKICEVYKCDFLFCTDELGNKYTFYDFSYTLVPHGPSISFDFCYNMLLSGGHIETFENILIDKTELEADYSKPIPINFNFKDIQIVSEPLYESAPEILKWMGQDCKGIFTKRIRFSLFGKRKFEDYEKIIWRLSEFFFLCFEDMFFYDRMTIWIDNNVYSLKSFRRASKASMRKKSLRTNCMPSSKHFCHQAFNSDAFSDFVSFREDSGIMFDVFRTTAYSESFREDYPLRLSQVMEGLANYLDIADTEKRRDTFNSAIQLSLYSNDFIKEQLPQSSDIQRFAKALTEHRNKFSHVKSKGSYLQGDDNEWYAEILYTTIRVLIVKYLQDESKKKRGDIP